MQGFFRQIAIRLEDHLDRLFQILTRFFEGRALRVGTRKLFDEGSVAFRKFSEHRGEFNFHAEFLSRKVLAENYRIRPAQDSQVRFGEAPQPAPNAFGALAR